VWAVKANNLGMRAKCFWLKTVSVSERKRIALQEIIHDSAMKYSAAKNDLHVLLQPRK